jgi:CRISPR-associated protein Csm4
VNLYSLRLVPESPWLTPWQGDTLSGLLCRTYARQHGGDRLQERVIGPALANRPKFVLSDAFPGDYLPMPAVCKLADRPAQERKSVKRVQWLKREHFVKAQRGEPVAAENMIAAGAIHSYTQLRNSIARAVTDVRQRGGLFPKEESVLEKDITHLTIYVRIEPDFVDAFREMMKELESCGFGADASAGKGQFRIDSNLQPAEWLDEASTKSNATIVLSTFQPSSGDPTDGAWEAFTKYGKLGPDFGLENVFKRPLIMLRPGATFHSWIGRGWLGRTIPMQELVSSDLSGMLQRRGVNVCHLAFGLCVPMCTTTSNPARSAGQQARQGGRSGGTREP